MAKQSGLHQIRGKVGEHSYYRQTGISSGLIRSINQGMSARVKTGEEYANTRLNNTEFGAAANVAGLLGQMVTPKFRPMILPFSQSKMAKEILRLARENSENWGQRVVSSSQTPQIAAVLSAQSKRNPAEFVSISATRQDASTAVVKVSHNAEQATLMASLGIDTLTVSAVQYDMATGQYDPLGAIMRTGYLVRNDSVDPYSDEPIVAGAAVTNQEDMNVETFVPAAGHAGHQFIVFVVLPMRTINSVTHILQEYCSFYAVQLPANA